MMPYDERESDLPEWEEKEEEIPQSLQRKWQKEESEGVRAKVCRNYSCISCPRMIRMLFEYEPQVFEQALLFDYLTDREDNLNGTLCF